MIVGVIGSGSIGPDLAYGFASALASEPESKVYLLDIKQEALDKGMERIRGYVAKGVSRGKISARVADAVTSILVPTLDIKDLADCHYVLEAATEDLAIKRVILRQLEDVVPDDCLIGFATSGLPRERIAAEATRPERCFVNHPFFPAWRSLPVEVVSSGHEEYEQAMLDTLRRLGKVPVTTADVECFAGDDIFCNYCSEAARIVQEGVATPAQVDAIVNSAIGGGGPFNVLDATRGNLLTVHCQELMEHASTGTEWFRAPSILEERGNDPWHDPKDPGDPKHDDELRQKVLDRILAVLLARTYFVVDNDVCDPTELDWLTRTALGFQPGLVTLAEDMGMDKVRQLCQAYAAEHPGFHVPKSIEDAKATTFYRNISVTTGDDGVAVVRVFRPEVKNALNRQTLSEIRAAIEELGQRDDVRGIVLSSFDGALAGADLGELSRIGTPEDAVAICQLGHDVCATIEHLDKPVIAAVQGPVMGGGAELAMACHGRVIGQHLVLAQPEVNLGIIPGYGGTQRLPRLVGLDLALDLLRTGRPLSAKEALRSGWATTQADPGVDVVDAARDLIQSKLAGELPEGVTLGPVATAPVDVPSELPSIDIGHRSRVIDAILVDVVRQGLTHPLADGLTIEAQGFGRCTQTIDMDIGMKNFIQNGPRVPAMFMHE